jgi:integrase/recombinase XerD
MSRISKPNLSYGGQVALNVFEVYLRIEEDLSAPTLRNYLSDLRQFMAWCESTWAAGREGECSFTPAEVATPSITRYRTHLQTAVKLKPATVNRHLISLKRYFAWAWEAGLILRNSAKVVKLVEHEEQPPRHISDQEENSLVAAVTEHGAVRDRTIIVLMLHTGLRAREVCTLQTEHIKMGKRSGTVYVHGKRNKYREVPLNATARATLAEYLPTLDAANRYLFPSQKTGKPMTERALGHQVEKYATLAKLEDVSPHDLRHRFGYRMAESVPIHRLAQILGHNSLDTTMIYIRGTKAVAACRGRQECLSSACHHRVSGFRPGLPAPCVLHPGPHTDAKTVCKRGVGSLQQSTGLLACVLSQRANSLTRSGAGCNAPRP